MMIRMLYFGILQDHLACAEENWPWTGGDCELLLAQLRARGLPWRNALAPEKIFRLVVNQQVVLDNVPIPCGAEVAILPPVTGG